MTRAEQLLQLMQSFTRLLKLRRSTATPNEPSEKSEVVCRPADVGEEDLLLVDVVGDQQNASRGPDRHPRREFEYKGIGGAFEETPREGY